MKRLLLILLILALAGSSSALARGGRPHIRPAGLLDSATSLQIATDRLEDAFQAQVRHTRYRAHPIRRDVLRELRQLEREAKRFRHHVRRADHPRSPHLAKRFERLRHDYFEARAALHRVPKTPWVRRQARLVRAHFLETRDRVSLWLSGRFAVPRGRYDHHPRGGYRAPYPDRYGPRIFGSVDLGTVGIGIVLGDDDWDDDWYNDCDDD
jgi:hypothetical protein